MLPSHAAMELAKMIDHIYATRQKSGHEVNPVAIGRLIDEKVSHVVKELVVAKEYVVRDDNDHVREGAWDQQVITEIHEALTQWAMQAERPSVPDKHTIH